MLSACPRETEVKELVELGQWPQACAAELRAHVDSCRVPALSLRSWQPHFELRALRLLRKPRFLPQDFCGGVRNCAGAMQRWRKSAGRFLARRFLRLPLMWCWLLSSSFGRRTMELRG